MLYTPLYFVRSGVVNIYEGDAVTDRLHLGKPWINLDGAGLYNNSARLHDAISGTFITPDPQASKVPFLSVYANTPGNPINYVDQNGEIFETLWDAANVAMGISSLVDNISSGNVVGAIVDGAGVIADAAAMVLPGVPGGVGTAIKASRAGQVYRSAITSINKHHIIPKAIYKKN